MSDVIDVLRDQYTATINQQKDWHFFSFLADYIKFINEMPALKPVMGDIRAERKKKQNEIAGAEMAAVFQLQEIKKKLLKEIKAKKIKCDGLAGAIVKLGEHEEGKINPRHYQSSRLEKGISVVIEVLPDKEEWAKKYNVNELSDQYIRRCGLSFLFHHKKEEEIWGIYDKLNTMILVMLDGYKTLDEMKKDGDSTEKFEGWMEEMSVIKSDGVDPRSIYALSGAFGTPPAFSSSSDKRIKEFKRDNYKFYLERLHFHLLKELAKPRDGQGNNGSDFSFDDKRLEYKGKPVVVAKSRNTNPHFLLEILLENPEKIWNNDELWERLFSTPYQQSKWKKVYNAAYDLNEKIAKQTGANDLIEATRTTTKINPKYVK